VERNIRGGGSGPFIELESGGRPVHARYPIGRAPNPAWHTSRLRLYKLCVHGSLQGTPPGITCLAQRIAFDVVIMGIYYSKRCGLKLVKFRSYSGFLDSSITCMHYRI
jgi:hypothetical protein